MMAGVLLLVAALPLLKPAKVDYNTEVKPLLNKHCLACHGGVKKQGGFSLLTREAALSPTESGKPAIVPGRPGESEMIRRLRCSDPEERMPYQKAPLASQEIALLKRWIREGANWDLHWAYRPVQAPAIPRNTTPWWQFWTQNNETWPRKDLDRFVLARLDRENLQPSPEADKQVLIQRLGMDLIGLPAPDSAAGQFLRDSTPEALERFVDTLLASPRFGERWAAVWLDLARYADTKGYERDSRRFIWRYRDWVIRAFNEDMPYDRFLTEQIAGDLLPNPDDAQWIATGFHRNTMTNDEGGTDNEEFRVAALLDRVNTTWTAVLGTTFNCVQCHSHPYDPFEHREYYEFAAFFNNTRDEDTWEDYPALRHFKKTEDSLKINELKTWLQRQTTPEKTDDIVRFIRTWQPAHYSLAADSFRNCELYDTKWLSMRPRSQARMKQVDLAGKNQLVWRYTAHENGGRCTLRLDRPDGPVLIALPLKKTEGREIHLVDLPENILEGASWRDLWITYDNPALKTPESVGLTLDWLAFREKLPGAGDAAWAKAQIDYLHLLRAETDFTPVMLEGTGCLARPTHVFERGNWLVPGEQVQPCTPRILPPMPAGAPPNRLGLAQWLCDTLNPLTARTLVNRVWEQLFGLGLAETLEDLGSQGIAPVHPELLDHLAWKFMHEYDWSLKKLLREIVLSATYRQDSRANALLTARDPRNELLARGPRIRLSAEQIRDKALSVAGVLSEKMYGPGVMPYQPAGVWKSPWSGDYWKQSEGEDQYRRAVYTFVKRTSPYPAAVTFDLAPREVCSARRIRTNTPLQALGALNDSAMVDLARHLALRAETTGVTEPKAQIAALYRRAVGWEITPEKSSALEELYQTALRYYQQSPADARRLLQRDVEPADLPACAAALVTANAMLNLDEFLVKS